MYSPWGITAWRPDLRLGTLHRLKDASIPDEKEMFIIWEQLKKDYPGFSEYFKGATPDYEKLTVISNRELVENIIPHPRGGMVLLGDITGFSDANGSSGLYYGMAQACFWVDRIIQDKNLTVFKTTLGFVFSFSSWVF
jgi:hypothetical protein